jgi:hypothetical protein
MVHKSFKVTNKTLSKAIFYPKAKRLNRSIEPFKYQGSALIFVNLESILFAFSVSS